MTDICQFSVPSESHPFTVLETVNAVLLLLKRMLHVPISSHFSKDKCLIPEMSILSLETRVSSKKNQYCTVADPDLQIRGGGGGPGHPDSEIRRGAGLKNIFFGPSGLILV